MTEFTHIIVPLAKALLGEPNNKLSSKHELRYGSRGSLSIDLQKGTWFDHETNTGGGTLDLVTRETKLDGADRLRWMEQNGFTLEAARSNGKSSAHIVATYPYVDEIGQLLFEVVRFDPKDFRQRRPDKSQPGGWRWSTKGVRQVPYRLPDVLEAISQGRVVLVVEGERDANALWALNIPATCNAGGAGKWHPSLTPFFEGADVVIVPDHDPQKRHPKTGDLMFHEDGRPILPGQDHALDVARALDGVAEQVRILDLAQHWPDMPLKGDMSDWLAAGGGNPEKLYALLERTPSWSPDQTIEAPSLLLIQAKREFVGAFVALDYLIDNIMQRHFLYALTGQTGHAKSAIALLIAQLVGSADRNARLGRYRVEKGTVAYFVGENPDDIRMRLIGADAKRIEEANAEGFVDAPASDNIFFIPGVFNIGEMMTVLMQEFEKRGPLDLVIVDTSAAYFLGNDEISNTEMGKHARMLRQLTNLPGRPCVLVLCHPIKHATDQSQLLPRGGGAFLAEIDGNLTSWKEGDLIRLYHTKLRGPDFEPITFKLETITTPKLADAKGRQIPTVRARVISQSDEDISIKNGLDDDDRVLAARLQAEQMSLAEIATALGWAYGDGSPAKVRVGRALDRLEKAKPQPLAYRDRGRWQLTEKGKDAARKAALRIRNENENKREREKQIGIFESVKEPFY